MSQWGSGDDQSGDEATGEWPAEEAQPEEAQPEGAVGPVDVGSQRWVGGYQQETPNWCFAATEQTIQAAFGTSVSQEGVAHDVMISMGAAGSSQAAVDYVERVLMKTSVFNVGTSYAECGAYLDEATLGILRGHWGDLLLTGRTYETGAALSIEEVAATINGGGLIAFGNANHWKIIYGYSRTADGGAYVWVFDPMTGQETMPLLSAVAGSMQISYRVTG